MLATQFALRKLGLDPNKDVTFVIIGQPSDRFVALRTGRIQATLLPTPHWIIAEREGCDVLTDTTEIPFPYSTIATTRRFMGDNPDTVRKFMKSYIDAVHLLKTDRETGLRVFSKYLRENLDREILLRTYDQSVTEPCSPGNNIPIWPESERCWT
jgi:ABC-type nitrate/sulfonate/bicarbonate transport system substrate-binding protein